MADTLNTVRPNPIWAVVRLVLAGFLLIAASKSNLACRIVIIKLACASNIFVLYDIFPP